MLSLAGVTKSYGDVVALDRVDLEVAAGDVLGLLGPNGAGKTTLVSIVAGLRRPDAGTVQVLGIDVLRAPYAAQREIGLAPQALGIYPTLTVRQNLSAFGELRGMRGASLRERIEEVADALLLEALLHRRASTLSGGQQRRLHTALALLHRPRLVLLDEPTVGADVETRGAVLALVKRMAVEDGAAVCYSTHYLPEVEALDASVAFLRAGRIVARGQVREVIGRSGAAVIELRFDGPAPELDFPGAARRDGSTLLVSTEAPSETAGSVIAALGSSAARLKSVEFRQPSLETAYLALTGDEYRSGEEG